MSVKQLCNNYQENLNLMQRALRVSASFDIVSLQNSDWQQISLSLFH